jgi:hypothetical protein
MSLESDYSDSSLNHKFGLLKSIVKNNPKYTSNAQKRGNSPEAHVSGGKISELQIDSDTGDKY